MFTITDAQINAWMAVLLWPFMRIFGLFLADPFYSSGSISVTVRVGFTLLLTVLIVPVLPPMPNVPVLSAVGIMIAVNQMIIGLMIGMAMRLVFSAVEMAGHVAGLQMGLGFASFFDPQHNTSVPVLAQFLSLMTTLLFLAMNGHLIVLRTLIDSFSQMPPTAQPLSARPLMLLVNQGAIIFTVGLQLSMPVVGSLLVTNLAVGVMTRASPQLNIFAIGFPIMLMIGMGSLYLTLPAMPHQVQLLIDGYTRFVNSLMLGLPPGAR
ncbi:flagellar biosynthetic protein FliR [Silvimonas sp. JCM 19000]